jgi:hypothetical protein
MTDDENHVGAAVLVTGESRQCVTPRQLARWMQNLGKGPEKASGYAESTVSDRYPTLAPVEISLSSPARRTRRSRSDLPSQRHPTQDTSDREPTHR